MKIIKQGVIPSPKKFVVRFECINCECVYETEEDECSRKVERRITGIALYSHRCPKCNTDNLGVLRRVEEE